MYLNFCQGIQWGLYAYEYHSHHFATTPSPVILWIELGGKPKWLPSDFGYHDVVCMPSALYKITGLGGNFRVSEPLTNSHRAFIFRFITVTSDLSRPLFMLGQFIIGDFQFLSMKRRTHVWPFTPLFYHSRTLYICTVVCFEKPLFPLFTRSGQTNFRNFAPFTKFTKISRVQKS